jgi:hypothetical protein
MQHIALDKFNTDNKVMKISDDLTQSTYIDDDKFPYFVITEGEDGTNNYTLMNAEYVF